MNQKSFAKLAKVKKSLCATLLKHLQTISHVAVSLYYSQYSFRTQEPILNLRRTVMSLAREEEAEDRALALDKEIGQCWLSTAKIARE